MPFVDNLNDLPMFAVADECYAAADAQPQVHDAATGVIGLSTQNAVAEFLRESQATKEMFVLGDSTSTKDS